LSYVRKWGSYRWIYHIHLDRPSVQNESFAYVRNICCVYTI